MWKNKQLKQRSKKTLKSNYRTIICLCFILSFFGILPGLSSWFTEIVSPDAISENLDVTTGSNNGSTDFTPKLVKYLGDFADGSNKTENVASQTLSSFNGKGGMLYDLMYRIDRLVFTHDGLAKALISLGLAAYLAYYIFIKNTLLVGFSRFLMETRIYSKTKFRRVFFLFKKGGILNCSYTMIMVTLFLLLLLLLPLVTVAVGGGLFYVTRAWIFLLLGGISFVTLLCLFIAQKYALIMVPFILAESPLAKRKEVFTLSRAMMKGSKLHAIGLDLSFMGWFTLSLMTFGLLSTFFLTPYRQTAFSELFMTLRANAIDNNINYATELNDEYLTTPPESLIKSSGIQVPAGTEIFPLEYPEMAPFKKSRFSQYVQHLEPQRKYTLVTYILFFFIFSFIGWCWEVSIHLVKDGIFVNRGTMFGPWLPIYGAGGVLIIWLLRRFAKKPALLFACTIVLCGMVEYFTSFFLEMTKGLRWWDYSSYFLNLNGRICLEGLLLFAIGGCIFVYVAGPLLDNLLSKLHTRHKVTACIILMLLFSMDMFYSHLHPNSGKGITDYKSHSQIYAVTDTYKLPGFTGQL